MDYRYFNSVKHGLVAHPADWPIRRFNGQSSSGYILPGGAAAAMNRNRPANGAEPKRRRQAERHDCSVGQKGARTGHRSRRKALRCSALRLLTSTTMRLSHGPCVGVNVDPVIKLHQRTDVGTPRLGYCPVVLL